MLPQIVKLKERLQRWREVTEREFPDQPDLLDLISTEDDIDLQKLASTGAITTDTCNSARKTRRLLVEIIGCVYKQDCLNHLHNVWINAVANAVSEYMKGFLDDSSDNIATFL